MSMTIVETAALEQGLRAEAEAILARQGHVRIFRETKAGGRYGYQERLVTSQIARQGGLDYVIAGATAVDEG
jgi:hypothetical protein